MAEKRQIPTMSMELAIQRELEYRKKLASTMTKSDAARFLQSLSPLEVPNSSKSFSPGQNLKDRFGKSSHLRSSITPYPGQQKSSSALTLAPAPAPAHHQKSSPNCGPSMMSRNHTSPSANVPRASIISQNRVPRDHRRPPVNPTPNPSPAQGQGQGQGQGQSLRERFGLKSVSNANRQMSQNQAQVPRASLYPKPPLVPKPSYSGTKRKASPSSLQSPILNYYCDVCLVKCSGEANYQQHLSGQKHRAKVQLYKDGSEEVENEQTKCDLCEIWCSDQNNLNMHFNGKKHMAKVQEWELSQKDGERGKAKQLWCELCGVGCTNRETFSLHLQGKNHIARAYATEMKKKAGFGFSH